MADVIRMGMQRYHILLVSSGLFGTLLWLLLADAQSSESDSRTTYRNDPFKRALYRMLQLFGSIRILRDLTYHWGSWGYRLSTHLSQFGDGVLVVTSTHFAGLLLQLHAGRLQFPRAMQLCIWFLVATFFVPFLLGCWLPLEKFANAILSIYTICLLGKLHEQGAYPTQRVLVEMRLLEHVIFLLNIAFVIDYVIEYNLGQKWFGLPWMAVWLHCLYELKIYIFLTSWSAKIPQVTWRQSFMALLRR